MKAQAALIRTIFLSSVAALFLTTSLRAQVLLVANNGFSATTGTVSVVNSFARTVTRTLTVPTVAGAKDPLVAAINPAVTLGAVYTYGNHTIHFYDLTDGATTVSGASVPLTGTFGPIGSSGRDITFSQDGKCVVATHGVSSGGSISSVSVASRTEVTVLTGVGQRAVASVPGHPGLILSTFAVILDMLNLSGTCALTDSTSLAIPGASAIEKIVPFPNGQGALLPDGGNGKVHVIAISPAGVVSYVKSITVGDAPQSIAITPDGRHAYVFKAGAGKLHILGIDPANNVTDTGVEITVPPGPVFDGLGLVATDGNTVFVTGLVGVGMAMTTEVTMVSTATNTVIGTLPVGEVPVGMAYGGPMCPAHTVHGHVDTNVLNGHDGSSDVHHGEHGHLVTTSECLAAGHQMVVNGHHLGLTPEATDGAIPSALTPEPDFVAILNQDGLNAPAAPGTIVQLFGSAKGLFLDLADLRPALEFTPPLSGSPLYRTTSLPEVEIGGAKAEVLFSGLAPGLKGVWQINVRIPEGVGSGKVPVTIAYDGAAVSSVDLAVE